MSAYPNMDRAAVAGAGLAGTLMALFLARRGVEVDLYERRRDPRGGGPTEGRSINLALSHRGIRALQAVDMADALLAESIPMVGRMIHDESGRQELQPYGLRGECIYSISRRLLNERLLDAAEATGRVHLHFEHKVAGVEEHPTTLLVTPPGRKKPLVVQPDLLVAADGAFSAVRAAVQRRERFSLSQEYLAYGYKELTIPPTAAGEFAMDPNALHIWPRHEFMMIALPNPDRTFTCTLFLPMEGEHGFGSLADRDDIERFFVRHFADARPLLPALHEEFVANPVGSLVTVRCEPWTIGDRGLLLGDAAHAIVPFYGQGMNAAFEDCRLLDEHLMAAGDARPLRDTLAAFAEHRKQDADAIAELAKLNFLEMRSHVRRRDWVLRRALHRTLHRIAPERWVPLYTMVTFSDTPYGEALKRAKRQEALLDKALGVAGAGSLLGTLALGRWLRRKGRAGEDL